MKFLIILLMHKDMNIFWACVKRELLNNIYIKQYWLIGGFGRCGGSVCWIATTTFYVPCNADILCASLYKYCTYLNKFAPCRSTK
jgi:hypothetical protein